MRRGPLYMVAAGVMFTIMVTLVKLTRAELDAVDLIFWRGVVAVPIAAAFAWRVGLRLYRPQLFALRALLGFVAMMGFFHAAHGLTVANLSLIHKLHPIFVAIAAPLLLGAAERTGAFIWLLLVAGMIGCGLILAPDLSVGSTYGLFAVMATSFSAAAHICIRALQRTDDTRVLVLWFQISVLILSTLYIAITTGGLPPVPRAELWPYVIGIGVSATGGQLLMHQAYAEDRAAVVAAASYTTPLWGVMIDIVVFAALPDAYAIAGGAVIVAAGLALIFSRERIPAEAVPEDT